MGVFWGFFFPRLSLRIHYLVVFWKSLQNCLEQAVKDMRSSGVI